MEATEIKRGLGTTLLRGSFTAFTIRAIGAGLALLTQVVLARLLGASEYGLYIYSLTWVILLAQFSCVGFDTSLLRYLSVYRARLQWDLFRGILRVSFLTAGFIGAGIACLAAIMVALLGVENTQIRWVSLLLLPVIAITTIRQAVLRALKKIALSQLPEYIARPLLLIGISTSYYLYTRSSLSADTALIIHLMAATLTLILGTILIRRAIPAEVNQASRRYETGIWLKTSVPLLFLSGMILLMSKVDIIMIGIILGPEGSGIYAAAAQLTELMTFALIAANTIAAPMVSELYSSGKLEQLQYTISLATRLAAVFAVIFAIILIFFGGKLLGIYGDQFTRAYPVLLILAGGQLINAFSGSVGLILGMTGHQHTAARIAGASALVNILMNLIFIPAYGIIGAAIATSLSMALWNLWMLRQVKRKVNVNPSIFHRTNEKT